MLVPLTREVVTLPLYVVGLPSNALKYVPDWISIVPGIEPNSCVALVDESYILFHARYSMTARRYFSGERIHDESALEILKELAFVLLGANLGKKGLVTV